MNKRPLFLKIQRLLRPIWIICMVSLLYLVNQLIFFMVLKGAIKLFNLPLKIGEATSNFLFPDFLTYLLLGLLPLLLSLYLAEKFLFRQKFIPRLFRPHSFMFKDICFGLILGPFLFSLLFLAFKSAGWISISTKHTTSPIPGSAFLWMVLTFIVSAFFEEIMNRGFHLPVLASSWGLPAGIAFSAFLFSLEHLGNPHINFIGLFGIMGAGVLFATAYLVTGSLYFPVCLHLSWNLSQALFGFKVSGFSLPSLIPLEINGPPLWTGGEFGPEGGLAGIILMLLGTWLTWLYGRYRYKNRPSVPRQKQENCDHT